MHKLMISELTPAIIKNWITSTTTTTAKTTRNILSFLRSSIDEAVTDGLLPMNPVSLVNVGRYKETSDAGSVPSREVDPFSPVEVKAILDSSGNVQWMNLFQFAFETDMSYNFV